MIDFQESAVFKLVPADNKDMLPSINQFLIDGENVLRVFQRVRDQLVFTDKENHCC